MKLYFAGCENITHCNLLKECGVERMLCSYYLSRGNELKDIPDLLLDSGAFSAATQNIKIDIDIYCTYIKKYNIKNYACLDVIGDGEKTWENQKYMEKQGLRPIPTFHLGEDKKFFERIVNEYEYIGLGGMVPYAKNIKLICSFLDYCFHYILSHNLKTRCHGRGQTNYKIMKRYPFYSVDSTGWLAPQKFNRMVLFKNGDLLGFTSREYRDKFGIDFSKLHYKERNKISIRSYLKLEEYITKLHQVKGLEYRL